MKSFLEILHNLFRTIKRFPLPILAGCVAFVCIVCEIHFGRTGELLIHDYRYVKMFLECASGISLFLACDLFSEAHQVERSRRIGLYLLSFCILGLHYFQITPGMFDSETVFLSRYLIFVVCFHALVSFVVFYKSDQVIPFWQYNYFLLKRITTSLLYSFSLFAGLTSAMFALDKLFSIHIPSDYYLDLLAFIVLIFNTIFFLKGFPLTYTSFSQNKEFKKSIRLFVQYVLLPILVMYITILYLYMIKILVEQQLPNGWVCIPIIVFSILGILAYLLVYPIRLQEENRIIKVYAHYFFYILLPLLSLYFIAVYKRIMPYGITEDRYLLVVLGIWLVVISIYIITSKRDNIIVIPVSLFVLLSLSAVGPWGMFQLSTENQLDRLERLLKRNHLLVDHKLVDNKNLLSVNKKDAASIRSIFSYLNKRGEINRIHTWLGEEDQVKLDSAIAKNDIYYIYSIFPTIGAGESNPFELHHFFHCAQHEIGNGSLSIEGYKKLYYFNADVFNTDQNSTTDTSKMYHRLFADTLFIYYNRVSVDTISLKNAFLHWMHYYHHHDSIANAQIETSGSLKVFSKESQQMEIPSDSMTLYVNNKKLMFSNVECIKVDSLSRLVRVEGYLLY